MIVAIEVSGEQIKIGGVVLPHPSPVQALFVTEMDAPIQTQEEQQALTEAVIKSLVTAFPAITQFRNLKCHVQAMGEGPVQIGGTKMERMGNDAAREEPGTSENQGTEGGKSDPGDHEDPPGSSRILLD